ncbi:hypothetical protein PR202_gb12698 [Eleusine coracana subsp. coracana]|uniref:D-isomer specific 2-hydroxyacid dehydrogenase NAD-binding domain-containing protein n=1 Tax=Eleusine coracana subsp. coracana TaxID=191504 RepID=A0AAV5EQJ4_ELECO|nr:hypothetical protein PR202_gb12698 [Eleusine coracana subsp. coracana]
MSAVLKVRWEKTRGRARMSYILETYRGYTSGFSKVSCSTGSNGYRKVTRVLFCGPYFPASTKYTKEYLQNYPFIEVGCSLFPTGVDVNAATEGRNKVARIPGSMTGNAVSCAEMAIYLTLGVLRKQGSYLVNIARGRLLDYKAVFDHLESGHIVGLGIDVAWMEPFDPEDRILKFPNVIITPHVAGVTEYSSYRTMAKVCNYYSIMVPIYFLKPSNSCEMKLLIVQL